MTPKYQAAFFDLDDTLFDHQAHRREALAALRAAAGLPESLDVRTMERVHDAHLQRTHALLQAGHLTLEAAREDRLRGTLEQLGLRGCDGERLRALEQVYRDAYDRDWRLVPGARALLERLRELGVWIAIVTNGRTQDQRPKLERLGLRDQVDDVLVSQEIGCEKPALAFFEQALRRANATAGRCVVVGDLWDTDIVGGLGAGTDAIWLNRYGHPTRLHDRVIELDALEPLEAVLRHFILR